MLFVRSTCSNTVVASSRRTVQNRYSRSFLVTTSTTPSIKNTNTTTCFINSSLNDTISKPKNQKFVIAPSSAVLASSSSLRSHSTTTIPEYVIRTTDTMSSTTTSKDRTVQLTQDHINFGKKACTFLSKATDPYYAVATSIERLKEAGFVEISTISPATIVPGGKYYYIVHHTTFVAFTVGSQYVPDGTCGFHIIGGHTDSPNLSIKPKSKKPAKAPGVTQLAVQCYGGGLWHTWFDRDLSFSGQVYIRQKNADKIISKLVQCTDPIARVSTLCIHLQSANERDAFAVNKEEHTSPIIAATNIRTGQQIENVITDQITGTTSTTTPEVTLSSSDEIWTSGQEPLLLQRIATELQLNTNEEEIIDFHLNLYDTQIPTVGGMNNEFIYSARLDNLATVFCATEALAEHNPTDDDRDISLIACFDHEEVGSVSLNGAGSPVIEQAIRRISSALLSTSSSSNTAGAQYDELYATTIANSFCLSIDQAHAIHPNYASKHDPQHAPVMNGGIVIKNNANQRYATSRSSALLIREISRIASVPIQEFAVKNDCPCGSTIGPTISALTGIRTVDAGMPQLSMHSCREVMGTIDLSYGYQLFRAYFQHFRTIDSKMS